MPPLGETYATTSGEEGISMGKTLGANKDIEKLARVARKQGWTVEVTGGNHLKFTPPNGGPIFGGLTTCGPGMKKFSSALRKAGLKT